MFVEITVRTFVVENKEAPLGDCNNTLQSFYHLVSRQVENKEAPLGDCNSLGGSLTSSRKSQVENKEAPLGDCNAARIASAKEPCSCQVENKEAPLGDCNPAAPMATPTRLPPALKIKKPR